MDDLTTDEVRDTWVDTQLHGVPTAHAVRLVPGLQIHFDRWLGRECQRALADLRAEVEALPTVEVDLDPDPHGKPIVRRAVLLADVLALLEDGAQ